MDKEQITESTPTVCKFFRAAAVPILVFLVIYGFFLLSGLRLCPNTTGSMAPTIPAYSLCLIDTHVDYDSLQVGDIVVYDRPYDHIQVVHRIIAVLPDGIITKGDANDTEDGAISFDQVFGETQFHLPYLGYIAINAKTPTGIIAICGVLVVVILLNFIPAIIDAGEEEKKKARQATSSDKEENP